MYERRIRLFIIFCLFFLALFLVRLAQLQLAPTYRINKQIAELKRQYGKSKLLKTLRGQILDRNGSVLAVDSPVFELYISYELGSVLDERVTGAKLLAARAAGQSQKAILKIEEKIRSDAETLRQVLGKCQQFGSDPCELVDEIRATNERIWNLRLFQAWRKNCTRSPLYKQYQGNLQAVRISDFTADFELNFPNPAERLVKIAQAEIAEMRQDWPMMKLDKEEDAIAAQIELMNVGDCKIMPRPQRWYPYGSSAAQTIGWVSLPQRNDLEMFADDRLTRYMPGDVSGREGAEFVCETALRGLRGEVYTDSDGNEVRLETQFGKDVRLTIDIELQNKIEKFLASYNLPADAGPGMAACIIDVPTGQILSLVSLPNYDLNRARFDYGVLVQDKARPLTNRALNELYPPGSSVKPIILTAALQSNVINPNQTIDCRPTTGWPQCWITRQFPGTTHGAVNARDAIKGSCNVYFSHLADRIDAVVLQRWLYGFGYGRKILQPFEDSDNKTNRNFSQAAGIISSTRPKEAIEKPQNLPPLSEGEKRYFGLGQGNLRATPLQVANAMAAIARGGVYLEPTLIISDSNKIKNNYFPLGVSQTTLDTIYDGMRAVVNESGGTAYNAFSSHRFSSRGITVYGKTGSTEEPEHAWFAGFTKDARGRSIAISLVIEGGKSGGNVAAPIAADILNLCLENR